MKKYAKRSCFDQREEMFLKQPFFANAQLSKLSLLI